MDIGHSKKCKILNGPDSGSLLLLPIISKFVSFQGVSSDLRLLQENDPTKVTKVPKVSNSEGVEKGLTELSVKCGNSC